MTVVSLIHEVTVCPGTEERHDWSTATQSTLVEHTWERVQEVGFTPETLSPRSAKAREESHD